MKQQCRGHRPMLTVERQHRESDGRARRTPRARDRPRGRPCPYGSCCPRCGRLRAKAEERPRCLQTDRGGDPQAERNDERTGDVGQDMVRHDGEWAAPLRDRGVDERLAPHHLCRRPRQAHEAREQRDGDGDGDGDGDVLLAPNRNEGNNN